MHESLNTYLCAFVEQRIEGVAYAIKDRTFIEAVLDFDFEDFTGQGVFYRYNSLSLSASSRTNAAVLLQ